MPKPHPPDPRTPPRLASPAHVEASPASRALRHPPGSRRVLERPNCIACPIVGGAGAGEPQAKLLFAGSRLLRPHGRTKGEQQLHQQSPLQSKGRQAPGQKRKRLNVPRPAGPSTPLPNTTADRQELSSPESRSTTCRGRWTASKGPHTEGTEGIFHEQPGPRRSHRSARLRQQR